MFHKWPEIENHYNKKNIQRWVDLYPELKDEMYIVLEKIHGTNIQFIIDKDGCKIATRKRILEEGESFYDVWNVATKYDEFIKRIMNYVNDFDDVEYINLYGELYGQGIQKGVDYCPEKQIRFFGMRMNGILLSQVEFDHMMDVLEIPIDCCVPLVGMFSNLEDAIDAVNVETLTTEINMYEGNIAEGVVIQPYYKVYISPVGATFILKKKAENFKEKARERKVPREPKVLPPEIAEPKAEFESYITKNRLDNLFSKEGPIEDMKDIGKYIKLMMEDARKDFEKENDISHLRKKDQKQVFSGGGNIIAKMLKGELNNG
jgi:Rnl2 family RNA ligase